MGEMTAVWHEHPKEYPVTRYRDLDRIMPGDVALLGGTPRVIRRVRYDQADAVRSVEVVKLRRSGYPAPTTILLRSDLYPKQPYRFGGILGRHDLRATPLEARLQDDIEAGLSGHDCRVTEDDVVGILS